MDFINVLAGSACTPTQLLVTFVSLFVIHKGLVLTFQLRVKMMDEVRRRQIHSLTNEWKVIRGVEALIHSWRTDSHECTWCLLKEREACMKTHDDGGIGGILAYMHVWHIAPTVLDNDWPLNGCEWWVLFKGSSGVTAWNIELSKAGVLE